MSQRPMSEVDPDLHILDQRLKVQVDNGMLAVLDIAKDISTCCPGDDELTAAVKHLMIDFIDMEASVQKQVTALEQLKQMNPEAMGDPASCFDEKLAQLSAVARPDPCRHPKYTEMESKMAAVPDDLISDQELDTLRATLLGFTQDDEVALTQAEVNIKCPYSGQTMANPVRNTVCGHVYDRDPILKHIKHRKGRAKCPVGGCAQQTPLTPGALVEHSDLKTYIDAVNRRAKD